MKIDIFNTQKKYNVIYADPPWPQTKGNTMSLEEIKKLHEKVFNQICEQKHNVFMWGIDKYLP